MSGLGDGATIAPCEPFALRGGAFEQPNKIEEMNPHMHGARSSSDSLPLVFVALLSDSVVERTSEPPLE